jgi:hypothetical protein
MVTLLDAAPQVIVYVVCAVIGGVVKKLLTMQALDVTTPGAPGPVTLQVLATPVALYVMTVVAPGCTRATDAVMVAVGLRQVAPTVTLCVLQVPPAFEHESVYVPLILTLAIPDGGLPAVNPPPVQVVGLLVALHVRVEGAEAGLADKLHTGAGGMIAETVTADHVPQLSPSLDSEMVPTHEALRSAQRR